MSFCVAEKKFSVFPLPLRRMKMRMVCKQRMQELIPLNQLGCKGEALFPGISFFKFVFNWRIIAYNVVLVSAVGYESATSIHASPPA